MSANPFEGIKELFSLPADEMIYESFECNSGETLNYKGRLYISENFLSFSCNMIGLSKKFSIRMQDIKDIKMQGESSIKITSFNDKTQFLGAFGKYKDRVIKLIGSLYQGEFGKGDSEEEELVTEKPEGGSIEAATPLRVQLPFKEDTLMVGLSESVPEPQE